MNQIPPTMRRDHVQILKGLTYTNSAKVWCKIVVRASNQHSMQYMGRNGFKPKPLNCKAKTYKPARDNGTTAGLVVYPMHEKIVDNYASLKDFWDANDWWNKFFAENIDQKKTEVAQRHELKNGFKIVYEGDRAGCVLFHGDYMYSDYDLMSVTRVKDALGHGYLEDAVQKLPPMHAKYGNAMIKEGKLVGKEDGILDASNNLERIISRDFSDRTGIQMFQHGAQVNYKPGDPEEWCHEFEHDSYSVRKLKECVVKKG